MTETLFDNRDLARASDKETSREAAASIDHTLTASHESILDWLRRFGPATDLEMAEAMVRRGTYEREEAARRAVRTLREKHGRMVPAISNYGDHITHRNSTGRRAVCWIVGDGQPAAQQDTIAARAKRCIPGNSYVELDGRVHATAHSLLKAILG